MRMLRNSFLTLSAFLAVAAIVHAQDVLPADTPIERAVDHYLDARLKEEGVTPAPQADDACLVRRLSLDLVGRIPTVAETKAFVESSDSNKRVQLVERLMASPAYVRHTADELNVMLMYGTKGSVREYLLKAVAENRPWDQVFRELILADESDPKTKGSGEYLKARIADLDRATADVSVTFFGVNISCARCHDHPRVDDWKQDHFYGLKAFLARSFDNGGFLAEREYGQVKFKTTKGVEKTARMMFLTGAVLEEGEAKEPSAEEQKKEKEYFEGFKNKKQAPPPAKNSARAKLAEVALRPEQRDYFARSVVNRVWARLLGFGLVNPLDQMHSANPPSHPELLEWLARDTVEHGYDLKRLTRGLVLSQAYSRSSRYEGDAPRANLFAVGRVRPLSPMQLATSMRIATSDPQTLGGDLKPEELEKRIEGLESSAAGFASLIEQPGDDFQISVSEALLFSNGERVWKEFLSDGGDRLVGRLKLINDPKELVDTAVRAVLSRAPTADEVKVMTEYLNKRQDRRVEACRQLVWAMLGSSEFRFNY